MPDIISETKTMNLGIIYPKEIKNIDLNFLSLKKGFNHLPNFKILDIETGKKYLIQLKNKIFVDN
jgi:hypothetical protein